MEEADPFSQLPLEIVEMIVYFCDYHGLCCLGQTCKRYHELLWTDETRKKRVLRRWIEITKDLNPLFLEFSDLITSFLWKMIDTFILNPQGQDGFNFEKGKMTIGYHRETDYIALAFFQNGIMVRGTLRISFCPFRIEIGDFFKNGNGAGTMYTMFGGFTGNFVNHALEGIGTYKGNNGIIYQGEFVNGDKEGQGLMTWPDGFSIEGEWYDDALEDHEDYVHPIIQKAIQNGQCTSVATEGKVFPQTVHLCDVDDYRVYCESCVKHGCHSCGRNDEDIFRTWYQSGQSCECTRLECKVISKKTKITHESLEQQ
eukprot:TRINITY_DN1758_c0_g1_i1.p1 TRINITY_DN1758_c0_g1~~TRINITY_DN1758_c0_g1_i1.p1  ORF type:complete len:313 (-),score=52.15 TRINITY_DN1758_c0_g1_i1:51-989(-)